VRKRRIKKKCWAYDNAGVAAVNSKVEGLAPGLET
jgi:hypothetical protein